MNGTIGFLSSSGKFCEALGAFGGGIRDPRLRLDASFSDKDVDIIDWRRSRGFTLLTDDNSSSTLRMMFECAKHSCVRRWSNTFSLAEALVKSNARSESRLAARVRIA